MEKTVTKRRWPRRVGIALAFYFVHYLLFGYHCITGRVVDEETGKPIEGAVVLGVWTYEIAVGFSKTEVYKNQDAVTDKNGRFFLWGVWNPLMNRWLPWDYATLTAYKPGYVAWASMAKFKDGPRKDYRWKNGLVLKMGKWKEGYSFIEHESFISVATVGAKTQRFADAMDWETDHRVEERDRVNEKRRQERGR